ncbi:MAG: squalene/phytoene synthase family protein [Steroidobacteraceae bacterium]
MSGGLGQPDAPPAGSPRWYAWLFTPQPARGIAALLFALESEWRSIAARSTDHGVAHLKLHWWREEIQRLAQGKPRHPLTQALATSAPDADELCDPLAHFLTSIELELAEVAIDDEAELERFLSLADGFSRALAVALTGRSANSDSLQIGSDIGQAVRGVQIVADWRHAPANEHRRLAVLRLAARSRASWEKAIQCMRHPQHQALRGLRVLGQLHMKKLDRMQSENYRVPLRGDELPAIQCLWTAWRAARQH